MWGSVIFLREVGWLGGSCTTQVSVPPGPGRDKNTYFLLPLSTPEQHGVEKAAWGWHFTHLGPTSVIHRWVVDLPLYVLVCLHILTLEVLSSSHCTAACANYT